MARIKSGIGRTANSAAGKIAGGAKTAVEKAPAPSPNPMTNLLLADLALRGGGRLLRHAVERAVLGAKYDKTKAKNIVAGRSMAQTLLSTALVRIATRSVPGALAVGGGLLAKTLYDRQRAGSARREGAAEVAAQIDRGDARTDGSD